MRYKPHKAGHQNNRAVNAALARIMNSGQPLEEEKPHEHPGFLNLSGPDGVEQHTSMDGAAVSVTVTGPRPPAGLVGGAAVGDRRGRRKSITVIENESVSHAIMEDLNKLVVRDST